MLDAKLGRPSAGKIMQDSI